MQDNSQDNSQRTTQEATIVKPKQNRTKLYLIIAGVVVVMGIIACLVYFLGLNPNKGTPSTAGQTPAASIPQAQQPTTPPVSTPATPPVTQPPATTTPTPTPTTPPQTPSQPSTPTQVISVNEGTVVTKQAYAMVLTLADMGAGWSQTSAASPRSGSLFSSSHMVFTKGSAFSPVVQNTVCVYRTVNAAINSFEAERAANASATKLSNPNIGDQCFFNESVAINKLVVFRKNNVVVWVQMQQDKTGDPLHYAQIVLPKITQ